MTIFYVDPVSGNDASAGTSFATRWQTLLTGAGTGKVTAGDTIRIIASPDPTSMAQDATWTDGSSTVDLTTAVTTELVFSGAWVASANASSVASSNRKIGVNSSQIAVTAAFTTGKAAYRALGTTLDLSSYQQISCWINLTVGTMAADGNISLRLCSDTIGNVTVNTIPLRRCPTTAAWQASTFDNGAALGASIQSIAIYIESDRGAQTILINHVLACKASSEPDSLTLNSLISKNVDDEAWIGINSISGTSILLDNDPLYTPATTMSNYSGITSTQLLYKREPIVLPTLSTAWGYIQNSGTVGNPITYTGGWNRTDMSTQTGDTYISSITSTTYGIYLSDRSNINIERLNVSRFANGIQIVSSTLDGVNNINITAKNINSCSSAGINFINANPGYLNNINISIENIRGHSLYGINGSYPVSNSAIPILNNNVTVDNLNSNKTAGLLLQGSSQFIYNITNLNRNGQYSASNSGAIYIGPDSVANISVNGTVNITNIKNNGSVFFATLGTVFINNTFNITGTVSDNNTFINTATGRGNTFNLNNSTITNNTYDLIAKNCSLTINGGNFDTGGIKITNATYSDILLNNISVTGGPLAFAPTNTTTPVKIIIANLNGNAADNRIYYNNSLGNILTDSSIRHTASGISWKMTAGFGFIQSPADYNPLSLPVAKIACNSGTLVTASVWVYRTSTDLTTKFVCAGGQIAGVPTNVSTSASGAIDTWEQLTITFTPSQQGVVELQVDCYGAAASVYVDDFSVSQA